MLCAPHHKWWISHDCSPRADCSGWKHWERTSEWRLAQEKLGTQNLALKTWDDFTTQATGEREGREDSTSRDRRLSIHVCACAGEEGGRAFTNSEKTMLASRRLPPARYWNTARARNKSFSDAWPATWTGVNKKASAAGAAQVRPLSLVLTFAHTTAAEGTERLF